MQMYVSEFRRSKAIYTQEKSESFYGRKDEKVEN